jgi:hypothetical protein
LHRISIPPQIIFQQLLAIIVKMQLLNQLVFALILGIVARAQVLGQAGVSAAGNLILQSDRLQAVYLVGQGIDNVRILRSSISDAC